MVRVSAVSLWALQLLLLTLGEALVFLQSMPPTKRREEEGLLPCNPSSSLLFVGGILCVCVYATL